MGEVIHVLNIMKCMDSDIMYIINVYNDIWNATHAEEVPSSDLNVTDTVCVRSVPGAFLLRKPAKHVVPFNHQSSWYVLE